MAKNHIFERFGVNVNDIIDRLMKMVDIAQSKSSTETSEK
ncbi:hypothetical protein LEP1GSC116_3573 [Leptospira interrogans serovar Icterohaemorrhagiae str. Verdun HP]|uniref:Uncharacterized protein n=4 Tax=Leptospira interrogans TaxID=173 RepID=M3FYL3_LEPIR|nr:hypothetical protein LEP1GSC057_4183 [Leptospira interrogans str. Brem 329]EMG12629.1 hypothetical protein LEP1GSC151_0962 [Leptospira interrogans serovar Grippotyphosa str. LT2186]EMG20517.1 hypothetical protein LEP1GSC150_1999 [Leptospira interrogans serovar Copenhageni str. LT2050]EMO03047.1 hypothetical protein LEP1GSC116_3573 [Leptospira interrogans serovar Icterohaemorrhagiae str. Verdun HP]EMY25007.1 hypothetical protein LEP1GSC115_2877 [Leptospira interrogans serovar Australis str. 2